MERARERKERKRGARSMTGIDAIAVILACAIAGLASINVKLGRIAVALEARNDSK